MTDEQTAQMELERADTGSSGIGRTIVQSFRNSVERMKNDKTAGDETMLSRPFDSKPETTTSVQLAPARPERPERPEKKRPAVTVAAPRQSSGPRQTRRARLRIARIDPWSVMKTALLFGVAGWIILIVATWAIFTVLAMTGLYDAINSTVAQVFAAPGAVNSFQVQDYVNTTRATALAALVGAVDVIILTALATIFAFLYNLSATVMGGLEVTMAED